MPTKKGDDIQEMIDVAYQAKPAKALAQKSSKTQKNEVLPGFEPGLFGNQVFINWREISEVAE